MLTIGARPITLPERITAMIFASVLNCLRKATPDSGGIDLSVEAGHESDRQRARARVRAREEARRPSVGNRG
jgi:hypothetical protein